ncbi:unnamed protein product [Malus baccata var. baccata]
MKNYGVQESWTKTLVIENLYDRELSCDLYEPMVYLSNGEIIMSLSYNDWIVVCYNQKRKSLRDTKFTKSREFRPIGYNPCFDVAKAEEVKRVQGARKCDKPFAEGSSGCAGSGMPPHKSTKLDSGHDLHTLEEDLPRATNSAVSQWLFVAVFLNLSDSNGCFVEDRDRVHSMRR